MSEIEPVAWRKKWKAIGGWWLLDKNPFVDAHLADIEPLFTAAQMRQAERDAILRAAKICEDIAIAEHAVEYSWAANEIRALLTTPDGEK